MMNKKILLSALLILVLAGCATSSNYVSYTALRFPPKDKMYTVIVYPASQALDAKIPYYVIGKVSIEGFASNGVNPESLADQAREIAQKRGADAVINAKTESFRYYGGDALLRFKGELIVYAPAAAK